MQFSLLIYIVVIFGGYVFLDDQTTTKTCETAS